MPRSAIIAFSAAFAGLLIACVAPIGIGPGPIAVPVSHRAKAYAAGSAGFGLGSSREQFQAEASARVQIKRWFSMEAGLVYDTLHDTNEDGRELTLSSAMPYLRPTFYVKNASFGVALSGLGAGGGGGGAAWGMIEPRLGYGGDDWSVYVSWLRHGATAVGGSTLDVSSQHWRVGADYYFGAEGTRLGISAEITAGDDSVHYTPAEGSRKVGGQWDEEYLMGGIKLRVMSGGM